MKTNMVFIEGSRLGDASLKIKCESFITHFGYKIPGNNDWGPTKDELTSQNDFHLEFVWLLLPKTVPVSPSAPG